MKLPHSMFGITELLEKHSQRTPGFQVRLGWKDNKPALDTEFSIKDFKTREFALRAATKYRDKELNKMKAAGTWPVDLSRAMNNTQVNNKSGVNGVHRARQWGKLPGGKQGALNCFSWVASWYIKGKIKTASFGETKWGQKEAFQMACNCREARSNIYV